MGRKSLVSERTNQILDAFEQCLILYGFDGATLQRTADLAQVNLGMIHHYIGRKNDLLKAMVERLIARTQQEMAEFDQHTPQEQRLPLLLSAFFEEDADQNDKIIDALYASGEDNVVVQNALNAIQKLYTSIWAVEIGRIHPHLSLQRCTEIGLAVLGLAISSELLHSDDARHGLWRDAAETLINNP